MPLDAGEVYIPSESSMTLLIFFFPTLVAFVSIKFPQRTSDSSPQGVTTGKVVTIKKKKNTEYALILSSIGKGTLHWKQEGKKPKLHEC